MTPAENRSERRSTAPPRRCSGDMYGSVPSTAAVWVSRVTFGPVSSSASRCAMPKSASCAPSAPSSTFAGLRSRWTTPRSCACASAANRRAKTAAVSGGGSAPGRDARAQVAALDQRHREPRRAVLRSVREHADDGRMFQARERRDLAREAGDDVGIVGQRRREELQRHGRAAVGRRRAVDGPHAAAAQARVDPIAADVAFRCGRARARSAGGPRSCRRA